MAAPASMLPVVSELSPRVTRVLGLNPGKFTLEGTNTYLVGTGPRRLLVDTGEGRPGYVAELQRAMRLAGCSALQEVVLTHAHPDHVLGVPQLREAFGPHLKVSHFSAAGVSVPAGVGALDPLVDGQVFRAVGASLRAVHTPGHAADHVSFVLEEENALFSGDCILGSGSVVFSDLHAYMKSLQTLEALRPARIYPAHGPVVESAKEHIAQYIEHRLQRERQVVQALHNASDGLTAAEIVAAVYTGLDAGLVMAAQGSVLLHLHKLHRDGRVAVERKAAPAAAACECAASTATAVALSAMEAWVHARWRLIGSTL